MIIEHQPKSTITTADMGHAQAASESSHLLHSALMREAVYTLLSSLFLRPVTQEFFCQMADESILGELANLFPLVISTKFRQYLLSVSKNSFADEVIAAKKEYMSLFTVPTGRYVAPFEDIYRGKNKYGQLQRGPLLGVRAIAAKEFYREAGAKFDHTCNELPNHVGIELAFMSFLCQQEAAALTEEQLRILVPGDDSSIGHPEVYRGYQSRFLDEHLTRWFPLLNEEIQLKSSHPLYLTVSDMTQAFLQLDLGWLEETILDNIQ